MDLALGEVLAQSRATTARLEAATSKGRADSIPRLERALPQIGRESRRLIPPNTEGSSYEDRSAGLRLLSERGVDTLRIERNLEHSALLSDSKDVSIPDTDLEAHCIANHEAAVMSAITSTLHRVTVASRQSVATALDAEWEAIKREAISLPSMQANLLQNSSMQAIPRAAQATPKVQYSPNAMSRQESAPMSSSFVKTENTNQQGSDPNQKQDPIQLSYQTIVRKAVYSRASPVSAVAVATELDDAVISSMAPRGDISKASRTAQHLHAMFTALRYISREALQGKALPPPENAFGSMREPSERRSAVLGALRYLCLQFREDKMRRELEARPRDAIRGGVPGLIGDVRAYLNLTFDQGIPQQLATGPCVAGLPMWPQVYFCMRAGDPQAALEVVDAALNDSATTSSSVYLFRQCLSVYIESGSRRSLSDDLLMRLVHDYGVSVYRGLDSYQRACYVVLARIDPAAGDKMKLHDEDYSLLFFSIEDYLWLRLSVARLEGDPEPPGPLLAYGLNLHDVQREILEFGPAHFDERGDTPVFYALILILCGDYISAIKYLQSGARALSEAVHLGFVLYYYGMIFCPHDMTSAVNNEALPDRHRRAQTRTAAEPTPGFPTVDGQMQDRYAFSYDELLWSYVSQFAKCDPATAAVYIFTLRGSRLRNRYLEKLILETEEFNVLLGRGSFSSPDRTRGVLDELWPLGISGEGNDISDLVSFVSDTASVAERRGAREAAAFLYDVTGETDKVAHIFTCRLSAEMLSGRSESRRKILADAKKYQEQLLSRHDAGLRSTAGRSFVAAVTMFEFFDTLRDRDLERAWNLLTSLNMLPLTDEAIPAKLREANPSNDVWTEAVCNCVPDLVVGAVECLVGLNEKSDTDPKRLGALRATYGDSLREAARVLVNFAGLLPSTTEDVSSKLIRLEVLMA